MNEILNYPFYDVDNVDNDMTIVNVDNMDAPQMASRSHQKSQSSMSISTVGHNNRHQSNSPMIPLFDNDNIMVQIDSKHDGYDKHYHINNSKTHHKKHSNLRNNF